MQIIDGNAISDQIVEELKEELRSIVGVPPCIAFIRVGSDPASISYVNRKQRMAHVVGIKSELILFPETVSQEELFDQIDQLNSNPNVHGILIQSPLPKHLSEVEAFNRVTPIKDVDGFNAQNIGRIVQDDLSAHLPCTPSGILELLSRSKIETAGKHIVVMGRGLIVGKPASLLLLSKNLEKNATVTICHSFTQEIEKITRQADIIIAAMGQPQFLKAPMVKPGAVIIDVGISRIEDPRNELGYRLIGDVDFDDVAKVASRITPVPGGVGPMTVAMLLRNTIRAYKLQSKGISWVQNKK